MELPIQCYDDSGEDSEIASLNLFESVQGWGILKLARCRQKYFSGGTSYSWVPASNSAAVSRTF